MSSNQREAIEERLAAAAPDIEFFVTMGNQLCANWPRRLFDNRDQMAADVRFHNHAPDDMRVLLAEVTRLNATIRELCDKLDLEGVGDCDAWEDFKATNIDRAAR